MKALKAYIARRRKQKRQNRLLRMCGGKHGILLVNRWLDNPDDEAMMHAAFNFDYGIAYALGQTSINPDDDVPWQEVKADIREIAQRVAA